MDIDTIIYHVMNFAGSTMQYPSIPEDADLEVFTNNMMNMLRHAIDAMDSLHPMVYYLERTVEYLIEKRTNRTLGRLLKQLEKFDQSLVKAKRTATDILEHLWLMGSKYNADTILEQLNQLSRAGRVDMNELEQIIDDIYKEGTLKKMAIDAIKSVDFDTLERLYSPLLADLLLKEAAKLNNVKVVEWMLQEYPQVDATEALLEAAEERKLKMVEYLVNNAINLSKVPAADLIRRGDLMMLELLNKYDLLEIGESNFIHSATYSNQPDMIIWLLEKKPEFNRPAVINQALDRAVIDGKFRVADLLKHEYEGRCSKDALLDSVRYNKLASVEWLHENCFHVFTKSAVEDAIEVAEKHRRFWGDEKTNQMIEFLQNSL